MIAKLVWSTPDADQVMGYCARVSNPANQDNPNVAGLLRYCARHGHWSVFEMASACLEINTTRDIARQILRHRSFSFQEFSQRYADASLLGELQRRECRLQDHKNRQNSIGLEPHSPHHEEWRIDQEEVWAVAIKSYKYALERGVAKEVARALLPEGLTPSRMYMSGTLRSWIHWLQVRLDPATQKEHREVATQAMAVLREVAPVTFGALFAQSSLAASSSARGL